MSNAVNRMRMQMFSRHAVVAAQLVCGAVFAVPLATAQEVRWAPLQAASAVPIPPSPQDPTDAKAYAVFDRHCASCHQSGKLQLSKPARGLGHILDLQRLGADATLVRPGQPDASRLFTLLQMRQGAHEDIELAASDLESVRDWINGVKANAGCADRAPLTEADDEKAIAATAAENPLMTRHLSLRARYNACASATELKAYRHALTVALNSLSWAQKPVVLSTIDDNETLIRVDLAALGWDVARWQRLVEVYPYTSGRDSTAAAPNTLRADWLATHALKPPLYYDLLGMPDRLQTLQSSLKIDAANDVQLNRARRIGVKTSTVARGSRLLQRHSFANGGFWTTYEYAPTPGRPDLFDAPGGPGTRGASKPDASLVMFNLPSGYTAFFMANGDGLRLNDLPQSIVRDEAHPSQRLSIGADCFSCHSRGVTPATDDLRARITGDTSVPRDIREKALALIGTPDEMRPLIEEDNTRLGGALAQSGLVPGAELDGVDPLVALMRAYDRDVTVEALAAELAVPLTELRSAAGRHTGIAGDLIDRIVHGPVSRRSVERGFAALNEALAGKPDSSGYGVLSIETDPAHGLQLAIKTGPAAFKAGDALSIRARASENCYLTLINIDRSGRGTVVFPNDFEQNNYLEAGREIRVPSDGAPYVFRLRDPGREMVIGHCMTASKSPPGIRHDFERQRFTELGDYRAFLNRTAANEPDSKAQSKNADPKSRRRPGARPPAASGAPQKGENQGRSAIMIDIAP